MDFGRERAYERTIEHGPDAELARQRSSATPRVRGVYFQNNDVCG
jgi:hypothetical protein